MSGKISWRPINGILLLDKPLGISSNTALQQAKRLFAAAKAGHSGSLDPLATGLLPICFGEATKFSQILLEADKTYQVTAKLGVTTTTADSEGKIVNEQLVPDYSDQQLEQVLQQFRGEIMQTPSMYSALKYQGQPLYKLARQGIEVTRAARKIHIYQLMLLQRTKTTIDLEVVCSKGTYIRNLVEDVGTALGCGAHVSQLRRLGAGPYQAEQMLTFEQLNEVAEQGYGSLDKLLLPIDSALSILPKLVVSEAVAYYVCRGQAIVVPKVTATGVVRLYRNEAFIGIGEINVDGKLTPQRLLNTSNMG